MLTLETRDDPDGSLFARIQERVATLAREERQHQEELRTLEAKPRTSPSLSRRCWTTCRQLRLTSTGSLKRSCARPWSRCGSRSATTAAHTRQPAT